MKSEKLRDNWIVGFLVVKTGDSTCHPRDSKEGYLYRTELGVFISTFVSISQLL